MAPQNLYSCDNDKWKTCFVRSLPEESSLTREIYFDNGYSHRERSNLSIHYVLCPIPALILVKPLFRMNSAPSSRSLLDIERGSDYANGTVGFPTGEFLVNTNGQVRHGVGFYPQDRDIDNFLVSRQVRPSPLPDLVLNAIQTESGVWTTGQPVISAPGAPVARLQQPINQAEKDGRDLSHVIEAMTSLNDVARHFSGVPFDERTYRPDGKLISARVRPALVWRVRKLNCEKSRLLLA
jgi:hypothetical protein